MSDQIIPGAQPVPSTPIGLEVTAQRAAVAQRSIISAREPIVTPREVTVEIPDSMPRSGLWGEPRDIIRYVHDVNDVPDCAAVEIEESDVGRFTRITFRWWEIDALVPREGGGY
ncbi:hypothetical protein SEA_PHONEGINGI_64 [Microbacterium phage Phonegingi]|nr:hypothetical protein SEA_PHONEGINGI_64 [Microbacterium phage Phonegingi]